MSHERVLLGAFIAGLLGGSTALGQTYGVNWFTIDGGGTSRMASETYELRGTLGQPDAGVLDGADYVISGGFWASQGAPQPAPLPGAYPHNRLRNRYISFDPNKAQNDGNNVAFRVSLKSLLLASCDSSGSPDVEGWPCRTDNDCRACSMEETPCWTAQLHCSPFEACDLTGAHCVNDQAGSIGMTWWVGPEHPTLGNDVHLLVSAPYRKVSADWAAVVHVADCEIVPLATYGVRAVNIDTMAESDELAVSTIAKPDNWWGDCVGPLGDYCTGNWAPCTSDPDCPAGETCLEQWPPPDGFANFHDVSAAVFTFSMQPGLTTTDVKNVDLHGNDNGDDTVDPPNYVVNFVDIANMISAFQGRPYPYADPGDCPDIGAWP